MSKMWSEINNLFLTLYTILHVLVFFPTRLNAWYMTITIVWKRSLHLFLMSVMWIPLPVLLLRACCLVANSSSWYRVLLLYNDWNSPTLTGIAQYLLLFITNKVNLYNCMEFCCYKMLKHEHKIWFHKTWWYIEVNCCKKSITMWAIGWVGHCTLTVSVITQPVLVLTRVWICKT